MVQDVFAFLHIYEKGFWNVVSSLFKGLDVRCNKGLFVREAWENYSHRSFLNDF